MLKRYEEAYRYLKLLWVPRPGDHVSYQGKRCQVLKVTEGKGVTIIGVDKFLWPSELDWRPTPSDFDALLLQFRNVWVYSQKLDGLRQVVGIPTNGRVTPVRGKPAAILSQLLNLRSIDSKLSLHINRVFEAAHTGRNPKDVRVIFSKTKDSSPS